MIDSTKTIWYFTTPDELRQIADKMEAICSKATILDSLTIKTIEIEPNIQLRIVADYNKCTKLGILKRTV